jgi:predicted transcriptional regulator
MAEPKSIFDQVDDAVEAQAIAEAEADIAAGLVYSHDKVKPWLEQLAKGDFVPFDPDKCK